MTDSNLQNVSNWDSEVILVGSDPSGDIKLRARYYNLFLNVGNI